ncbi:predicted protein [Lichtheimia corymbifera JMRC:FSU:9682]|uniref:Uncharacterized protein n=1 Tax=Lichtheimia corymbifera JMRC:FSU:9682 TaxID=1263082 RepID=A0A068S0J2_9FUNG|nr:predicted protein [Lichtheimia corymbifera JMRC:FSU:9682]
MFFNKSYIALRLTTVLLGYPRVHRMEEQQGRDVDKPYNGESAVIDEYSGMIHWTIDDMVFESHADSSDTNLQQYVQTNIASAIHRNLGLAQSTHPLPYDPTCVAVANNLWNKVFLWIHMPCLCIFGLFQLLPQYSN